MNEDPQRMISDLCAALEISGKTIERQATRIHLLESLVRRVAASLDVETGQLRESVSLQAVKACSEAIARKETDE